MNKRYLALAVAIWVVIAANSALASRSDVDTNSALKALAGGVTTTAYRAGYYSAGDGGDALYYWNGSSSCTDDGGSCIQPNSGTGRWLLNNNGAVSVQTFGAKCDGSDDRTPFVNALAARTAVFVPANTTCTVYVSQVDQSGTPATGGGLVLNDHNRLYGQDEYTSVLAFAITATPSFDFVTSGKFVNIVVTGGVAKVTTLWSHQLPNSSSVVISGSATTGLNGTKTITLTGPDSFTYSTTAPNGTYTDPTHITGPSGLGLTMIRGPYRDNSPGTHSSFVLDNITISYQGAKSLTWVDLSSTWNSRVHNVRVSNSYSPGDAQTFLRCADLPTLNNTNNIQCFFNSVRDTEEGNFDTFLHHSSYNDNSCCNTFERGAPNSGTFVDTTGTRYVLGSRYQDFYINGDSNSVTGYDFYPQPPEDSLMSNVGEEGAGNYTFQASNTLGIQWGIASDSVQFPNIIPRVASVSGLVVDSPCHTSVAIGTMAVVTDWNGSVTNGTAITGSGGGSTTILAICTSSGWQVH